ncbi:MAG: aldo/keto reductase [Candidatus Kariarchaeaceae archaeon]|jgi:predicted aldo/keto reductase-like oxidoreductase
MKTRLDELGVHVGPLGLGVEHFAKKGTKNTINILETALEFGLTHYDLVFNLPYFLDTFGEVMSHKRDKITFSAHLGTTYNTKMDKIQHTRKIQSIQSTFEDLLTRIKTDYVDIAMIQYMRSRDDFDKIIQEGTLDYVVELKKQGTAKAIGISSHNYQLLSDFIEKAPVDVVMTVMNFATGTSPTLIDLIAKCKSKNIAVIGIKTLLKGKVLTSRTESYGAYYCGGNRFRLKLSPPATARQCFDYVHLLGADSVVFGVKTGEELSQNMQSYNSSGESKDAGNIIEQFQSITNL